MTRWGQCLCGGTFEERRVDVRLTAGDRTVVLSGMPQGACPVCGTRVYKPDALARIEATMKSAGE